MPEPLPVTHPLRVAALPARRPTRFDLVPDAAARAALARILGIDAVHTLRFRGEVRAKGGSDFVLEGKLDASVVQPCILTLAPVTTRISETVIRTYIAEAQTIQIDDAEIPAGDDIEQLGSVIDPGAVMTEALALAIPDYPRAPWATLDAATVVGGPGIVHAAPGVVPLRDADLHPFAGLGALASQIFGDTTGPDDIEPDAKDDTASPAPSKPTDAKDRKS